ncbi:MAG: hypothetical protein AB8E15_08720 [Bdellovibrionales bacterium]
MLRFLLPAFTLFILIGFQNCGQGLSPIGFAIESLGVCEINADCSRLELIVPNSIEQGESISAVATTGNQPINTIRFAIKCPGDTSYISMGNVCRDSVSCQAVLSCSSEITGLADVRASFYDLGPESYANHFTFARIQISSSGSDNGGGDTGGGDTGGGDTGGGDTGGGDTGGGSGGGSGPGDGDMEPKPVFPVSSVSFTMAAEKQRYQNGSRVSLSVDSGINQVGQIRLLGVCLNAPSNSPNFSELKSCIEETNCSHEAFCEDNRYGYFTYDFIPGTSYENGDQRINPGVIRNTYFDYPALDPSKVIFSKLSGEGSQLCGNLPSDCLLEEKDYSLSVTHRGSKVKNLTIQAVCSSINSPNWSNALEASQDHSSSVSLNSIACNSSQENLYYRAIAISAGDTETIFPSDSYYSHRIADNTANRETLNLDFDVRSLSNANTIVPGDTVTLGISEFYSSFGAISARWSVSSNCTQSPILNNDGKSWQIVCDETNLQSFAKLTVISEDITRIISADFQVGKKQLSSATSISVDGSRYMNVGDRRLLRLNLAAEDANLGSGSDKVHWTVKANDNVSNDLVAANPLALDRVSCSLASATTTGQGILNNSVSCTARPPEGSIYVEARFEGDQLEGTASSAQINVNQQNVAVSISVSKSQVFVGDTFSVTVNTKLNDGSNFNHSGMRLAGCGQLKTFSSGVPFNMTCANDSSLKVTFLNSAYKLTGNTPVIISVFNWSVQRESVFGNLARAIPATRMCGTGDALDNPPQLDCSSSSEDEYECCVLSEFDEPFPREAPGIPNLEAQRSGRFCSFGYIYRCERQSVPEPGGR